MRWPDSNMRMRVIPAHNSHGTSRHFSQPVCKSRCFWHQQQMEEVFLYKENQQSFKRVSHQSTEFQIPLEGWQATWQEADRSLFRSTSRCHCCRSKWGLFACGSKWHGSKLSKTAFLSVCKEEVFQGTMLGNRLVNISSPTMSPYWNPTLAPKSTSVLPVTKYKEITKNSYNTYLLQTLEPTKTPENGNCQHSPPNWIVVGGNQQTIQFQANQNQSKTKHVKRSLR